MFEGVGVAGGDRIDLSGIDADTGAAGNRAFAFGGTGIGRVSLVDTGGKTLVRCNTDREKVKAAVQRVNATLPEGLKLRHFVSLHKEFDADDGEITTGSEISRHCASFSL